MAIFNGVATIPICIVIVVDMNRLLQVVDKNKNNIFIGCLIKLYFSIFLLFLLKIY